MSDSTQKPGNPTVELIFDADCPNVPDTRAALRRALTASGLTPSWREWDRADPQSPDYTRGFGSPTVLVNRRDVGGLGPSDAPSCRLYKDTQGRNRGVPPDDLLLAALRGAAPCGTTDSGVSAGEGRSAR